jgi:hypothetical protein
MPQYTFLIGATALATTSAARGTEDGDIILIVKASTNQPSSNPEAEALVFTSAQQAAADAISAALLDDPNALDSPNAEISAHIANAKGPSFTVTKRSLAYVTAQWRRLVQQPQASPPNHPPPPPQPQADPRVGRLISGRIPTRFLNNQPVWSDIVNAKVVRRTEDVEDSYLIDSDQAGLFYLDGTSVDLFSAPAPPERDVLHLPSSSPSEQLVIQQLAIIKRAPFSRALSDPAHLDAQEAWEILKLMRPASANQPIPSLPFLQHVLSFHAPSLHMVTVTNLPPNPTLAEIVAALSEALMRAPFVRRLSHPPILSLLEQNHSICRNRLLRSRFRYLLLSHSRPIASVFLTHPGRRATRSPPRWRPPPLRSRIGTIFWTPLATSPTRSVPRRFVPPSTPSSELYHAI